MYPICYLDFQILDAHTDVVESKLFDIGGKHLPEYLSTSFEEDEDIKFVDITFYVIFWRQKC